MAVPSHEYEQEVHELVAVRQRRLEKHHIVGVLEFADRAFEKTQAERRIVCQQSGRRRPVDVANDAWAKRFGTGLCSLPVRNER